MLRFPIQSTNLVSVGYDFWREVLEIEFAEEAVYEYLKVPYLVYMGLVLAESAGAYFAENIKGQYEFRKLSK